MTSEPRSPAPPGESPNPPGQAGSGPVCGPITPSIPWRDARFWLIVAVAVVCAFAPRYVSPPLALLIGLLIALARAVPADFTPQGAARLFIQASVVLLGFGLNLHEVARAGVSGMAFAAGTIVVTLALGALLGIMLHTDRTVTTLISSGTAICGGSAIAAVGSVIGAAAAPMGVAIGTVFALNAVGVFTLPHVGRALGLSAEQFGVWSAIAVHDIAGVTGAADAFDRLAGTSPHAVTIATVVKLARTLWIIPLAAACGWWYRRSGAASDPAAGARRTVIPWFIALFVLAAGARTLWPVLADRFIAIPPFEPFGLVDIGKRGMVVALLLIGLGLSVTAMRRVGWRAFVLGTALWLIVCAASLVCVRFLVP